MDLPMWWLVYLCFILGMVLPMVGVILGLKYYKRHNIASGKAVIINCVLLSLGLSAVGVYELTVDLGAEGNGIYLVWFGFWGPFVVMDFVYVRMMFFTRWAKRMMGAYKDKPSKRPKKVMTIDDIGKDWETRIKKRDAPEEE